MKLTSSASEAIVSDGFLESSESTVNVKSVKFYQLMSERLYSDKIGTIVRELLSNAWDAHKVAGTLNTPIDIQLPNHVESQWVIRDYGTGLSHNDVMHLYMNYLTSTKDQSNDAIGGFGLGSKSPFAYTDSFTVSSYFNNEKRTYVISFDRVSPPKVYHASTEKTMEPNGLEVIVPVSSTDISEFVQKTVNIACRFSPQPILSGTRAEYPKFEYIISSDNWRIVKKADSHWNHNRSLSAIIGNIEYKISKSSIIPYIEKNFEENAITLSSLCSVNLEIDFSIGELSITPDRESLSYDKQTIQNICEKLNKILFELVNKTVKPKIDKSKSLFEASQHLAAIDIPGLREVLRENVKYKGLAIPMTFYCYYSNVKDIWDSGAKFEVRYKRKEIVNYKLLGNCYNSIYESAIEVRPFDNSILVWDSEFDKFWNGKIKSVEEFTSKRVILVRTKDKSKFNEVRKLFGGMPFVKLKSVKTNYQSPNSFVSGKVFKNQLGFRTFVNSKIDFSKGGLYVNLYGSLIDYNGEDIKYEDFRKIIQYLERLHIVKEDTAIYGIPKTLKTKPSESDGWVNFFDFVAEKFENFKNEKKEEIDCYHLKRKLERHVKTICEIEECLDLSKVGNARKELKELFTQCETLRKTEFGDKHLLRYTYYYSEPRYFEALNKLPTYLNNCKPYQFDITNHPFVKVYDETMSKYPILKMFRDFNVGSYNSEVWDSYVYEYLRLKSNVKDGDTV